MQKKIFAFATMLGSAVYIGADGGCGATPYFSFRSTGENLAREQVGWEEQIHLFDMEAIYGSFYIAPYYQQTFNNGRIARCLFGEDVTCGSNNCGGVVNISGSCVADRGANDWLADYFGLPTDFQSTVSFRPRIRNFVLDLGFFLGFDEVARGLWLRVHMPINWASWSLNFSENVIAAGVNDYNEGYFSDTAIARSSLLNSATEYFAGGLTPILAKCDGSAITFNSLCCTRWAQDSCANTCSSGNGESLTKTRPADIEVILGWDAFADEDYHFGFGIRFTAPTGNKPKGDYLFEPVVGLGGNWTLGGTITAHAMLWRSEDEESSFGFYLDANISHLFKTCQSRCFDLKCRPNSRYALAMRLGDNTQSLCGTAAAPFLLANSTASDFQFADEFASVSNLTRSNVNVSASVQGDVAFKFCYARRGFSWDLGYEFYGRSCEDICRTSGCNDVDLSEWALKGDAQVYGFDQTTPPPSACPTIALAGSDSLATIHGGSNRTTGATPCAAANLLNPRVDNVQLAWICPAGTAIFGTAAGGAQTRTSIQPITLSADLIDLRGTKIISNKIYTNISYAWLDRDDWTPFLGLGAEIEFRGGCCDDGCSNACSDTCNPCAVTAQSSACNPCGDSCGNSCGSSNNSCSSCGTNSWGIWLKGGVSFN